MTYKPSQTTTARSRAFVFMAAGVFLWLLSSLKLPVVSALLQLAALAMAVVGLQYLIRFSLSEYRYVIDDLDDGSSELLIFRKQGSRDIKVAHIELSKVKAVVRLADSPDIKSKYGATTNRFNYCQNPGKAGQWVILYRDGEDFIELRFEPDDAFAAELRKRIVTTNDNTD